MDQPEITIGFSVEGQTEPAPLSESEPCPVCQKPLVAHRKEEVFGCGGKQREELPNPGQPQRF